MLTCEILEINLNSEDYENQKIKFSCFDDEESGVVAFVDCINEAHANFLHEQMFSFMSEHSAYEKMIEFINIQGIANLKVGQTFVSD